MPHYRLDDPRLVTTVHALLGRGVTRSHVRAQLDARRWQRHGHAIVLHNGPLSREQRWFVALRHNGARALLTGLTAAQAFGLRGWERDVVDVLVPAGARALSSCPVPMRLRRARDWTTVRQMRRSPVHVRPDAFLVGAATFTSGRAACGLLAAGVQQRVVMSAQLADALRRAPRLRHRALLCAAVADIAQGADALSEIDFVRLCQRAGLPTPQQQTVRRERGGRRRYLDATWRRRDGRLVVAEVDGALHLVQHRWWDDQLRQNELSLADALVLRFPSVVVRTEPATVLGQLRRALRC